MRSAEAETRTQRVRPLPRLRGGSQNPSFRTRRKSRGRTGIWRVRVLVVESLGSRYRSDVSKVLVGRSAARRCVSGVPSLKEATTSLGILTMRGGRERAKTVRRSPAMLSRVWRGVLTHGLRSLCGLDTVPDILGFTPVAL